MGLMLPDAITMKGKSEKGEYNITVPSPAINVQKNIKTLQKIL